MVLNDLHVSNILCIKLNKGEFLDSRIVRLNKGWTLRFICGTEVLGRTVKLVIEEAKVSHIFKKLAKLSDLDSSNVFDYKCASFGAFVYEFFLLDNEDANVASGRGFFSVIPEWNIAGTSKILSLNGLSICSHLAKLLGSMNEWEDRLRVTKEAGYNVIHLTPVQTLGISNSSYSVANFHELNPIFKADFSDLEVLIKKIEQEWHILTIQDVVWNHAAKNAKWLWEHPECAFNCENSPHLRPAFVVDRALHYFSLEIVNGKWESKGIPTIIDNDAHLAALYNALQNEIFPSLRLYEFFQVDVDKLVQTFQSKLKKSECQSQPLISESNVQIIQDPNFCRFGCTVDIELALQLYNLSQNDSQSEAEQIKKCCDDFRLCLIKLNTNAKNLGQSHCSAAIQAIIGHVSYERVAGNGPRRGALTENHPLVTNYFLYASNQKQTSWENDEKLAYDSKFSKYFMACNGWLMNADPLVNFAEKPSLVYLRRELICWGDCVKLNYGRSPDDCPYLWNYMKTYTELCAKIFHGFRIDNCHSTPIHVAEYLLNAARKIRHNLYVVAELFTGSETLDNLFVNRLGITSLIRECQNAPDSHEQGRFVYRYGGDAVGAFRFKSMRPAVSGIAHALFYDQTHDNPSPYEKRTAYDYVPTAAMTAMAYCASGSTRGYDEFVNFNIDVVNEKRLYNSWSAINTNLSCLKGMLDARRLFNNLHATLAETGFSEIFVDQVNEDIVAITRHNPITHESVLLISHCCFSNFKWTPTHNCGIPIADDIVEILFEVKTVEDSNKAKSIESLKSENQVGLCGMPNFHVEIFEHVLFEKSDTITITKDNLINFKLFPSGSVIALRIKPNKKAQTAFNAIHKIVENDEVKLEFINVLRKRNIQQFNYLLFQSDAEELSEYGTGAYDVPNFGKLTYCGLQGIYSVLKLIQEANDLGHPLCSNLRDGTWIIDYLVGRLMRVADFSEIAHQLQLAFHHLGDGIPHFLRPCYFELLFSYFYGAIKTVFNEKNFNFKTAYLPEIEITRKLALSSVSFVASIKSAKLPPIIFPAVANADGFSPSLSAGLPHFAEGIWRNWGRDTFIALPGTLLLNNRFGEARDIILAYAGSLRHGLIPNLLAEGKSARYNCRDAVWFWLVAILKYVKLAPNGIKILTSKVLRLYATDDANYLETEKTDFLHETMYEAISRHFQGISFRERNAGSEIDEHMNDEGFNVNAYIDKKTGFVFGGNAWNCGTWMDKMGSSVQAGNRGQPATSRDGAAVELQGLALFVAEELSKISSVTPKDFPHTKITDNKLTWTWEDWAVKLRNSFFTYFFVDEKCSNKFVHRRGIVKDTYGSSAGFTDFQLRPNFCIALNAVPNILEIESAWEALETARKVLVGPLGICTLDPKDWNYNGYYNNDDNGTNKQTAKGWNYHQGPEWLWVKGEYLSARLKVAHLLSKKTDNVLIWQSAVNEVLNAITTYSVFIKQSLWSSLPELTNRNGSICHHSCKAQAWSIGCFTDVLYTLNNLLLEN